MPQRREQTVIGARKIDIDRFNIARPGRNGVQIPDRQICEHAAFDPELELEIFFGRVVQRDPMTEAKQERPVKDYDQGEKKRDREKQPANPTSRLARLRFTRFTFIHEGAIYFHEGKEQPEQILPTRGRYFFATICPPTGVSRQLRNEGEITKGNCRAKKQSTIKPVD
jgi:hypothetical protein